MTIRFKILSSNSLSLTRTPFLILTVLIALLGCTTKGTLSTRHKERIVTSDSLPNGLTVECQKFIKSLPESFSYNFMDVPENWDHKLKSAQIRIFYYFFKPAETSLPTTIFFNGGPGFSGHNLLSAWKVLLPKSNIPVVFMDQRGTGCSSAYPVISSEKERSRLRYYGSRAIVRDAEVIRETLLGPNSKWQIFGQSFGGLIVHRYLTIRPESVLSAHIHGFAISENSLGPYYFKMLGQKRISDIYFSNHQSVQKKLIQIRKQVKPDHCFSKNIFKICGDAILDGILAAFFNSNLTRDLESTAEQLLQQDGELNLSFLNHLAQKHVVEAYASADAQSADEQESANQIARKYIGKMEMESGQSNPQDPGNCKAIIKKLSLKGNKPKDWLINPCRFVLAIQKSAVTYAVKLDPIKLQSIVSFAKNTPQVPIYLYSGAQDSFEPSELFGDEMRLVPGIHYTDFQTSGHEGFITESQVWKDLSAPKKDDGQ